MENVIGYIHSVESFGALDGPGVRYVLFLQGCPLRCLFCHNPDSWAVGRGQPIGSADVVRDILRYRHFIEKGGVTLSGGEPLMQPEFAASILEGCRENGLHTALDTSGGVPLLACRQAVDAADMLLLDMKAADEALFRRITGRSMDNTLEILEHCEDTGKRVSVVCERHSLRNRLGGLCAFLVKASLLQRAWVGYKKSTPFGVVLCRILILITGR